MGGGARDGWAAEFWSFGASDVLKHEGETATAAGTGAAAAAGTAGTAGTHDPIASQAHAPHQMHSEQLSGWSSDPASGWSSERASNQRLLERINPLFEAARLDPERPPPVSPRPPTIERVELTHVFGYLSYALPPAYPITRVEDVMPNDKTMDDTTPYRPELRVLNLPESDLPVLEIKAGYVPMRPNLVQNLRWDVNMQVVFAHANLNQNLHKTLGRARLDLSSLNFSVTGQFKQDFNLALQGQLADENNVSFGLIDAQLNLDIQGTKLTGTDVDAAVLFTNNHHNDVAGAFSSDQIIDADNQNMGPLFGQFASGDTP